MVAAHFCMASGIGACWRASKIETSLGVEEKVTSQALANRLRISI
jgi:hypothetical protein